MKESLPVDNGIKIFRFLSVFSANPEIQILQSLQNKNHLGGISLATVIAPVGITYPAGYIYLQDLQNKYPDLIGGFRLFQLHSLMQWDQDFNSAHIYTGRRVKGLVVVEGLEPPTFRM